MGWGGTHCTACVDWHLRDFPFQWEIKRLRKKWGALRTATKAVEQAGRWLRAFERSWPQDAPNRVEAWLTMKAKVDEVIRKVVE